jgi:hypothetical protein
MSARDDASNVAGQALLEAALAAAVPLWVERLRHQPQGYIASRARDCAQVVACRGDVILFRGKKGETAEAFNRMAEGIACAVLMTVGGVRIFGLHFEVGAK